jgi:lipoate-protein ligase A
VWLDVWLPRHDALWDDDVLRSSWWLGETWVRALEDLGAPPLVVHRGGAARTEWSDVVCFAGLGPGEVTAGTAKVVGVAQRRTRDGARLHSMAPLAWDPAPLVDLLAIDDEEARRASVALEGVATGVRAIVDRWRDEDDDAVVLAVEDAVLAALP